MNREAGFSPERSRQNENMKGGEKHKWREQERNRAPIRGIWQG